MTRSGFSLPVVAQVPQLTRDPPPYTQVHSLLASRSFTWARLLRLLATECIRMLVESGLDTFACVSNPLSAQINTLTVLPQDK